MGGVRAALDEVAAVGLGVLLLTAAAQTALHGCVSTRTLRSLVLCAVAAIFVL
jgi:hypothetical protein